MESSVLVDDVDIKQEAFLDLDLDFIHIKTFIRGSGAEIESLTSLSFEDISRIKDFVNGL